MPTQSLPWMYSRRFSEQVPGLPKLDDVALVMARGFNSLVQRVGLIPKNT